EDSPVLLAPAEFRIKLPVAHVQRGEPQQRRAIRLGKVKPDRLRIAELQARARLEAHMRAGPEGLFQPWISFPGESDNRCIKSFTVMKLHALAQSHLQPAVIKPAPTGGKDRYQRAVLTEFNEVLEDAPQNVLAIVRGVTDNFQFAPWRWPLCPNS